MSGPGRTLLGGVAVAGLALAAAAWWWPAELPGPGPAALAPTRVAESPVALAPPPAAPTPVASGRLEVDETGHFVPTPAALAWIDSSLFPLRDLDDADRAARLEQAIRRSLPASAQAGALDLARRNLAFREAARRAFEDPESLSGDLDDHVQWRRELRRAHYGPELAEALFGEEEDELRVQLEMRRVRERADLDPSAQAAELEALEAALPQASRERRQRSSAPLRLTRETSALRAAGASEAEVFALRAERLGPDAAQRLAALDAERRVFAERMERYRAERAVLLERGASASELDGLRAEIFAPTELARVRRLEAVEERTAAREPLPGS